MMLREQVNYLEKNPFISHRWKFILVDERGQWKGTNVLEAWGLHICLVSRGGMRNEEETIQENDKDLSNENWKIPNTKITP